MNRYQREVSDAEFNQAPPSSPQEWVITVQALGIAMTMGVPLLECLNAVSEITPNPRIRRALDHAYTEARHGNEWATDLLLSLGAIVDKAFIASLRRGEATGALGEVLLKYVTEQGITPRAIAQQVGRSEAVQQFTVRLVENLKKDLPILRSCRDARDEAEGEFKEALEHVINDIEGGAHLSEALGNHPAHFDSFYLNMVRAGERRGYYNGGLEQALDLLASS